MKIQKTTLPNTITLVRLIFSPLILPLLLVVILPYEHVLFNGIVAILFIALAITDFLDGYLARRFSAQTVFGAMLDPLADKFLLYATAVALVAIGKMYYYWAIIFIGREFMVMGLRCFALEYSCSIPVMWFGKIKTFFQYIYLALAIFNIPGACMLLDNVEKWALVCALFLTIASGYRYAHLLYCQIKEQKHVS